MMDNMTDGLIYKQQAIDEIRKCRFVVDAIEKIRGLPSVKSEILVVKLDDILEIFPPESFLTELILNKLKDKLYHLKVDLS